MKKFWLMLCLGGLLLTSCEEVFFQPEPANDPESLFENLWKVFNEDYGPTAERRIDWDALYATYRPQVTASTSDDELFAVINSMLATTDDGHVNLTAPGRDGVNANYLRNNEINDSLFNLDNITNNYLEPGYTLLKDEFVNGTIRGENIGYFYFNNIGDNFFRLDEFLNANSDSRGIIIDLRHNGGGDFTYCYSEMGRLVDEKRLAFSSRTKNGTGPEDFTAWTDWSVEPTGEYYNKPIVLLIDRYTISAGERAVMAFMTLPNVTIVGDTTCGAHATIVGRELANGWYYTVPIQNTLLPDGKTYEGVGLAPDIIFYNEITDVRTGLDRTLEKAIDEF
ncbi:MAG TPA: S41 family peptidase [Saprospiraceae bacterium]|nr:S41 family peptidase [Saprospiraceae bacterium]